MSSNLGIDFILAGVGALVVGGREGGEGPNGVGVALQGNQNTPGGLSALADRPIGILEHHSTRLVLRSCSNEEQIVQALVLHFQMGDE